ncbi:MAG TPA: thioredoxin family protein [Polyangia bacterium]|nr:thioredoxin family protein [Polyangia bacterium]
MKPLFALALAPALFLAACQHPHRSTHRTGPELVEAGPGPADAVVRTALAEAQRDGRRLLVYVSATWCEPCERFQKALRAGELDAAFPALTMLKFDHDRDLPRLQQAGYAGNLIPRFVIPGPDGRGTARRVEGGTKAEDTVATSIGPRLRLLLDGPPPS